MVYSCSDQDKPKAVIVCEFPEGGKRPIAIIDLDQIEKLEQLRYRLQLAGCNDSLASLNFRHKRSFYRVQTMSTCDSNYTRYCPSYNNYLEIIDGKVFKNDLELQLDSLKGLLYYDYNNNGRDVDYSDSPDKFLIGVGFSPGSKVSEIRRVLAEIADAYALVEKKQGLVIALWELVLPPPPPPLPGVIVISGR